MKNHSKVISPSGLKRLLKCKASVLPAKNPMEFAKKSSDKGTAIHALYEAMMNKEEIEEEYPEEYLAEAVNMYQECISLVTEGNEYYVEAEVFYNEDIHGTADFVMYDHDARILYIRDLKTGVVSVDPVNNLQMLTYAICAAVQYGWTPQTLDLGIVQYSSLSTWVVQDAEKVLADHIKWLEELQIELRAVLHMGKGDEITGEHCFFCPRKLECSTYRDYALQPSLNLLTDLTVPDPKELEKVNNDTLSQYYTLTSLANEFYEQVKAEMKLRLGLGQVVHGYELKEKNSRVFKADIERVGKVLKSLGVSEPFKNELKGIGDIEKVIGKGKIPSDLVEMKKSVSIVQKRDVLTIIKAN